MKRRIAPVSPFAEREAESLDQPELVLITKSQQGDQRAFETLVLAYEQRVYQLAYRMVGHAEDAADLAQEAFLRAYRRLGEFRGESSFATWILRIVSNVCLDELRRRRRQPVVSLDEPIEGSEGGQMTREIEDERPGPEEEVTARETQRLVQQAIEGLPPDYRLALVLRDIQGHSYEQIAEILGLNMGTVKSRINRARHALKAQLVGQELFEAPSVNRTERRVTR